MDFDHFEDFELPVEFVDTHCHLDLNKFDNDRTEVILRSQAAGLTHILIPSISINSSRKALKLAESNPMLFMSIGVQPNDAITWDDQCIKNLREIHNSSLNVSPPVKKIIAIGEIGLDYYWDTSPHEHQKKILWSQMELATELELPLIIHLREKQDVDHGEGADALLEIINIWVKELKKKNNPLANHPGVLHSFSGDLDTANQAIQLGFYIGVTGPVTYKNNKKRQDLIASIPIENLLLETDAPFLTPHPKRGQRNEPANIPLVAAKIAELHNKTLAEVAAQTCSNASRLFQW